MRIMLLAPAYMGLYKNIINELTSQGNEVVFIEDKPFRFDYRFSYKHTIIEGKRNQFLKYVSDLFINKSKYWDSKLADINELFFDILFVINGFSYDSYLLSTLRKYNNKIETKLYLWDNLYVYDFNYIIKDFDNCYTLDYLDGNNNEKLSFLPAFWVNISDMDNTELLYDIFMVGTNHSDRAIIVKKLIKQFRLHHLSYYIKLWDRFHLENEIYTHRFYSTKEYMELMKQSRCILDTERPSQTGPTVRMIWALALGKKIISTNRYLKNMPLYNPDQILIVDRNNPTIDIEFIKSAKAFMPSNYIMSLRIDNWIKTVLK